MALTSRYETTGINDSYTIVAPSGAEIKDARGRGFKFDAKGNLILAGAGEDVIGVGIMTAGSDNGVVEAGDDVTVQVRGMGRIYLTENVSAGEQLTTDANGNFKKAGTDETVTGIAIKAGTKDTLGFILFTRG